MTNTIWDKQERRLTMELMRADTANKEADTEYKKGSFGVETLQGTCVRPGCGRRIDGNRRRPRYRDLPDGRRAMSGEIRVVRLAQRPSLQESGNPGAARHVGLLHIHRP